MEELVSVMKEIRDLLSDIKYKLDKLDDSCMMLFRR